MPSTRPFNAKESGGRAARHTVAAGLAVLAVLSLAGSATAHNLGTTVTLLSLGQRTFEMRLECDLDALALGAGLGADDAELANALAAMEPLELRAAIDGLGELFARRVRLLAGDTRVAFEVDFPDRAAGDTLGAVPPTFLGLTARLRGALPAEYDTLRIRLSRAFPAAELTVVSAAGTVVLEELVPRGEDSSEFTAGGAAVQIPAAGADVGVDSAWIFVIGTLALAAVLWVRRRRQPRR